VPSAALPDVAATARTLVSTGPMHGVHPKPKATPTAGAAHRPNRCTFGRHRRSWYSHGASRMWAPTRNSAMARTTSPEIRVSSTRWPASNCPAAVTVSPRITKTAVNPVTKPPAVHSTWRRCRRPPPWIEETFSPVTNDK
jgi:hypothetical protein